MLGRHINNASSQFANVSSGLIQLGNKITSAGSLEEGNIQEIKQTIEKGDEVSDD